VSIPGISRAGAEFGPSPAARLLGNPYLMTSVPSVPTRLFADDVDAIKWPLDS